MSPRGSLSSLPEKVQIGVLHIRSARGTTTAGGKALLTQFEAADLQPSLSPPTAVLIVRRLTDPLPETVALHPNSVRVSGRWERAAREALGSVSRRAARPSSGHVPPEAEAVLFEDEAEMLACLICDLDERVADDHWWWQSFRRGLPSFSFPSASIAAVLRRSPPMMPALLYHLHQRSRSVQAVARLSPGDATALMTVLATAHGRPNLLELLQTPVRFPARLPDSRRDGGPEPRSGPLGDAYPPWSEVEIPATLEQAQACLLGVGLRLFSQPAALRSPSFLSALRDWWQAGPEASRSKPLGSLNSEAPAVLETALPPAASQPDVRTAAPAHPLNAAGPAPIAQAYVDASSTETDAGAARSTIIPSPLPEGGLPTTEPTPHNQQSHVRGDGFVAGTEGSEVLTSGPAEELERRFPVTPTRSAPSDPAVCRQADTVTQSVADRADIPAETLPKQRQKNTKQPLREDLSRSSEPLRTTISKQTSRRRWEGGVDTALGGVLYLINLMCRLDLPECFEDTWCLSSTVGPWGVLELLGRGLLSWDCQSLEPGWNLDSLWDVLAGLDGRLSKDPPGRSCLGSNAYRLPLDWNNQMSTECDESTCFSWAVAEDRLRLWSGLGYLLVECPRDATEPRLQAQDELRRFCQSGPDLATTPAAFDQAPVADLADPWTVGWPQPLLRWGGLVLPYVRLWLQRALGSDWAEAELVQGLLLRPGKLYVASTHLDLVMLLEDIFVPVRRAGLDRDPGWLVDWGRVIRFHFE